jgi:ribosomal protein L7/L12
MPNGRSSEIVDDLSKLTVLEAADLAKKLKEKWSSPPASLSCSRGASALAQSRWDRFASRPENERVKR